MHEYNNKNIVIHELVGLEAEVLESRDPSQTGIRGMIIKETKNLLYIRSGNDIKRIVKNISVFRLIAEKRSFIVEGREISFRSHERTEKALRFYNKRKMQG